MVDRRVKEASPGARTPSPRQQHHRLAHGNRHRPTERGSTAGPAAHAGWSLLRAVPVIGGERIVRLFGCPDDRPGASRRKDLRGHAEPEPEAQQVARGDHPVSPARCRRVRGRSAAGPPAPRAPVAVRRRVRRPPGGGGARLGRRGDSDEGVERQRRSADPRDTERLDMNLLTSINQRDEARDAPGADVLLRRPVQRVETRARGLSAARTPPSRPGASSNLVLRPDRDDPCQPRDIAPSRRPTGRADGQFLRDSASRRSRSIRARSRRPRRCAPCGLRSWRDPRGRCGGGRAGLRWWRLRWRSCRVGSA